MQMKEAIERRKQMFDRRLEVRLKKAKDYAVDENVHRNFEVVAEILRLLGVDITTPEGTCMFYIILKIDRACNILFRKKGKAECEALEDTIAIDLPNYIDLLDEILMKRGYYGDKEGWFTCSKCGKKTDYRVMYSNSPNLCKECFEKRSKHK